MSEQNFQGNPFKHTSQDKSLFGEYADHFDQSPLQTSIKLSNFPKYVRRQDLSRFLAKNEIFKLQLNSPGSIVECGCFAGGGLMTYAQLSSIYEPYNHQRRIIGFDTFSGFPSIASKDINPEINYSPGSLFVNDNMVKELEDSIFLHDKNRALSHINKTELVVGDALITIPEFIQKNPHLVISLLYLDFDLYEPTKVALENFIQRMPRGAVIAFDELNTKAFPGETLALMDVVGINKLRLQKTSFDPYISYAIID